MEWITEASPRSLARVTGGVYLLYFLTAVSGELCLRQAGISGISTEISTDAAATATMLLAHESAFRIGFALGLISIASYAALTALLYQLLKPVNKSLALLAAFFSLVALAAQTSASLLQLAPFILLAGSPYLGVFSLEQLQALALALLNLAAQVGPIQLVFFAPFMLLMGYLIFRSTFLPRSLGVLFVLAGVGWLTFVWPPLASSLLGGIEVVGFLAEFALMLWLLVMGVNAQRWQAWEHA